MKNIDIEEIRYILQNIPEKFTIAETGINASVHQEYLEYTNNLDFGINSETDVDDRQYGAKPGSA